MNPCQRARKAVAGDLRQVTRQKPRIYKMGPGHFGLAVHRSGSGNWSLELGPYVLTTEPGG
jgi:hypothetical protein